MIYTPFRADHLCDMYDLAHVTGWELYNLHDPAKAFWSRSVLMEQILQNISRRLWIGICVDDMSVDHDLSVDHLSVGGVKCLIQTLLICSRRVLVACNGRFRPAACGATVVSTSRLLLLCLR